MGTSESDTEQLAKLERRVAELEQQLEAKAEPKAEPAPSRPSWVLPVTLAVIPAMASVGAAWVSVQKEASTSSKADAANSAASVAMSASTQAAGASSAASNSESEAQKTRERIERLEVRAWALERIAHGVPLAPITASDKDWSAYLACADSAHDEPAKRACYCKLIEQALPDSFDACQAAVKKRDTEEKQAEKEK